MSIATRLNAFSPTFGKSWSKVLVVVESCVILALVIQEKGFGGI